jgi:hypothetical protein
MAGDTKQQQEFFVMKTRLHVLIVLASACSWAAARAESAAESPRGVCAKAQAAVERNDWKTVAQCLTPESRNQAAFWLCATAGLSGDGEAKERMEARWAALDQVMKKHDMDDDRCEELGFDKMKMEELVVAFATHLKDPDQLIVDVIEVLQKHGGLDEPVFIFDNLAELKIDDDTASGMVRREGAEDSAAVPIKFKRYQGEWRIEMFVFPTSNQIAKPTESP